METNQTPLTFKGADSTHISSTLVDKQLTLNLNPHLSAQTKVSQIENFNDFVQGLLALGDLEHSGDWDPCYYITIMDTSTLKPISFSTGSGNTSLRANERQIIVQVSMDNYNDLLATPGHPDPNALALLLNKCPIEGYEGDYDEAVELAININTVISIRLDPNE